MTTVNRFFSSLGCALVLWAFLTIDAFAQIESAEAADAFTLQLSEDVELSINAYPAQSSRLLIWVPAVSISNDDVAAIAQTIQQAGISVWHPDFFEAYFLARNASSAYKIPGNDIKSLLDFAIKENPNKKVFILASSRTAIPVMEGLQRWQKAQSSDQIGGLILNSPYFFVETPDPGKAVELMPIVSRSNLPIFILQPKLSPRYWQLQYALPGLQQAGSDVFVRALKNVRGRFHFRPDATQAENQMTSQIPALIAQAMKLLDSVNSKMRKISKQPVKPIAVKTGKKDRILQTYQGNPIPPELILKSLDGESYNLAKMKNRVVLVNFWTTWCPPCVHEMPSLQRLSEMFLNEPFDLLGVNMAQNNDTVETFLATKVNVDFPILMDYDGKTLLDWKVYAFPTTFVVDKHGKIRYALFGSIDWDTPEIVKIIKQLLSEPT